MAVRRGRKPQQRTEEHPTRTLIAKATADVLKEKGPTGFHVDHVLERTGLTRGAVYHHFENVEDMIDSALLVTYTEGVDQNITFVKEVLGSATTFESFREGILRANLAYVTNERLRDVRKLRAHAMSTTATVDRMKAMLAATQQRLTDEYVAAITEAQKKGWVKRTVDPEALAVFIQAYSFGIIVDDVSEKHVDRDAWAGIIADFFERCVFSRSASTKGSGN